MMGWYRMICICEKHTTGQIEKWAMIFFVQSCDVCWCGGYVCIFYGNNDDDGVGVGVLWVTKMYTRYTKLIHIQRE